MSIDSSIETILERNDAWLTKFDKYADQQKAPLLYVDMQSPCVNQLFSDLSDRLNREKFTFMHQHLQKEVPDIAAEKEILQTYQKILQSEPIASSAKSLSFTRLCVPQNPKKVEPMIHAYHIDRINRQLAYY